MLKLTQCLIVKNEKKNLARAVNWGKKVVDELIVVDTGSSDGTEILAEKLGAKVFCFDWKDDFSAARNFAISKCTGDWILFLDADEYFKDEDAALLRQFIEKIDSEYAVQDKAKYNVIETPWINIGCDSAARQVRIFKNAPYLRYEGAVHEQIHALDGGYIKVYHAKDTPAVYHTGYAGSDDDQKRVKSERNFKAAEKALEKTPGCAKFQLFAAEALMDGKKYAEAEKYFAKAMNNTDGSIWAERAREGYKQWLSIYLNMAAGAPGLLVSADRVYKEAAAKFPDDADFDIIVSLIHFKEKDVMSTIRFFNSSLSKKRGRISEKLMASNSEVYKKLSDICESLKKDNII